MKARGQIGRWKKAEDVYKRQELPRELERNFKINENIMRFLVIRKDA